MGTAAPGPRGRCWRSRACRWSCRPRAGPCAPLPASAWSWRRGARWGSSGNRGLAKPMLSRAVARLLPRRAKLSGAVHFDGHNLAELDAEALRRLRGRSLAFVFQDPMTSLNPVLTIGAQIVETLREHLGLDRRGGLRRAIELLRRSASPTPEQRAKAVSAPVLRRHAPAHDDRHRAGLRARTAHRRRAHHGARRHRAGADPGLAERAAAPSGGWR